MQPIQQLLIISRILGLAIALKSFTGFPFQLMHRFLQNEQAMQ